MIDWKLGVDIAQIVTAVSAVAAIYVATWLGLKGIRIAKSDNGLGQREFLFNQVDGVLESALALTASASEAANNPSPERGDLRRAHERFESRVRVLEALELLPEESVVAKDVQQFALAMAALARAHSELLGEGRSVLLPTIFDGTDDVTKEILADLAMVVHGHEEYEDDGYLVGADDGLGKSDAFQGTREWAAHLREKTNDSHWKPTVMDALRLVVPWARVKLGLVGLGTDLDGSPVALSELRYEGGFFDEDLGELILPPWPPQVVDDWLREWPRQFAHLGVDLGMPGMAPEDLTARLLTDLRAEFLDRVVAVVLELRKQLTEVGKA